MSTKQQLRVATEEGTSEYSLPLCNAKYFFYYFSRNLQNKHLEETWEQGEKISTEKRFE